jgi:asparagine synthase (glutamine-hydrolysing)
MCGIFGYASFGKAQADRDKFNNALCKIAHRGPDFQDSLFLDDDRIALGHVRLSIIDLTECGNQPMKVNDNYYVVYNGEIYNYIELRDELIALGHQFISNSDTEVLVKAYDEWKEDCVKKFNGMWAFVIYDSKRDHFFCSRDRFGVKPFVYNINSDRFLFSSEAKTLLAYDHNLKKPNYNSIGLFCRESIGAEIPETWFEGILRLQPGHNMIVKSGKTQISKYYEYPKSIRKISFEEAKRKFRYLFEDAVKLRMRSDVPVGTTLSSGLDSSCVVAGVRQVYNGIHNTYTADFPNFGNNEYPQAEKTNYYYHLNGHPVTIHFNDQSIDSLKKLVYHLESGHSSPAILPLWRIYAEAKKDVTVVLEGQGADELLGGYIQHFAGDFIAEQLKRLKFLGVIRNLRKLGMNYSLKTIFIFFLRLSFPPLLRTFVRRYILKTEKLLTGPIEKFEYRYRATTNSESSFTRALQYSHHYGDAISMAFAIESRLPFMDYRLVDFVMTLPSNYLIAEGKGKYLQREALKDILPDFINKDVKKLGFNTPIEDFFERNKKVVGDILLDKRCLNRGLFEKKELESLINSDFHASLYKSYFLFRLLNVELWFRKFIDQE